MVIPYLTLIFQWEFHNILIRLVQKCGFQDVLPIFEDKIQPFKFPHYELELSLSSLCVSFLPAITHFTHIFTGVLYIVQPLLISII